MDFPNKDRSDREPLKHTKIFKWLRFNCRDIDLELSQQSTQKTIVNQRVAINKLFARHHRNGRVFMRNWTTMRCLGITCGWVIIATVWMTRHQEAAQRDRCHDEEFSHVGCKWNHSNLVECLERAGNTLNTKRGPPLSSRQRTLISRNLLQITSNYANCPS